MKNINFLYKNFLYYLISFYLLIKTENTYLLLFGILLLGLFHYIISKKLSIRYITLYLIIYNLYPWDPLYSSNQSIYFPKILKDLNNAGLQSDWYSSFDAPYPFFNNITKVVINLLSIDILEFLPWIFLCISLMAIEKISFKLKVVSNNAYLVSFVTLMLIIWNKLPPIGDERIPELLSPLQKTIGITQVFLGGLSSFSIFSFVYQPQIFDLLFLLVISFFMQKKYVIGFFVSIFLGFFHYWLFLPTLVLYVIYIFKESNRNINFFVILILVPIFTVITLFNISQKIDINQINDTNQYEVSSVDLILDERLAIHRISKPNITFGTWLYPSSPIAFEFNYKNFEFKRIYNNEIQSGLSASSTGSSLPLEYLLLCFFGLKYSKNKELKYFLIISNFIWVTSFVLNSIFDLTILRTFQPWRISGICIFISTITLIVQAIKLRDFKYLNFNFIIFFLFALSFVIPNKGNVPVYKEIDNVDISTTQNLFVDTELLHFSLNSGGRPIYVSRNFPYSDYGIIEWKNRFELNEKIFNSKSCDEIQSLIKLSKFKSNILIFDSRVKLRNIEKIDHCNLVIINLAKINDS